MDRPPIGTPIRHGPTLSGIYMGNDHPPGGGGPMVQEQGGWVLITRGTGGMWDAGRLIWWWAYEFWKPERK